MRPAVARLLDRGPGWVFHGLCAVVAGFVLWSCTVPGGTVLGLLVGFFGGGTLAVLWVVRLVVVAIRTDGLDRRFAAAPLGFVLLVGLVVTSAPLHVRWALSEDAFAQAVRDGRTIAEPGEVERIGSYSVLLIDQAGGGTVFMLSSGGFLDVGFAHLPSGPEELVATGRFEAPEFVPLGDDWYRWTSTW